MALRTYEVWLKDGASWHFHIGDLSRSQGDECCDYQENHGRTYELIDSRDRSVVRTNAA
jgi:hypothetical protein